MGLEEIEVSHNQINELKGLNNLILLKKIDLSFNRLT
jgi:Leucine-rich repeat (LRR) protein